MQESNLIKLVLITTAVVFFVSCGGGGTRLYDKAYKEAPTQGNQDQSGGTTPFPPPGTDGTNTAPDAPRDFIDYETIFINKIAEERLLPYSKSNLSSLVGSIVFDGFTPLSGPKLSSKNSSQLVTITPVVTRIIDDEDNIGSIEFPTELGAFTHANVSPGIGFKLGIETKLKEDINGDGIENDIFNVLIPINFVAGKITKIDVVVSRVPSGSYIVSSGQKVNANSVLALKYVYMGPEGWRSKKLAINYKDGITTFDANNDEVFDKGDLIGIDRNNDGLFDDNPLGPNVGILSPGLAAGKLSVIEGVVLDRWPGRLKITTSIPFGNPEQQVIIDSRTALSTQFANEIGIFDVNLGEFVIAQGFLGPGDTFVAMTVIVFSTVNNNISGNR